MLLISLSYQKRSISKESTKQKTKKNIMQKKQLDKRRSHKIICE